MKDKQKNIYYFAYGSNMNPSEMERVKVRFSQRIPAILKGYGLRFNKVARRHSKEGYANIIPNDNEIVEGALYKIVEADLPRLDEKEGYYPDYPPDDPIQHYIRTKVVVVLGDDQKVKATSYIANPDKIKEGLLPRKSYLRHLLAAKDILSESYYKRLESWKTLD